MPFQPNQTWDVYCHAISQKEQETVPVVGPSIDRRSLALVRDVYNDDSIYSLVCFTCAQIKTHVPGNNSDIEYTQNQLQSLDATVLKDNLCFRTFKERYASEGTLLEAEGISANSWLWRRKLIFSSSPSREPLEVLCCPEDVQCDTELDKFSI